MAKSSSETPLMQQHRAIKQKYPDAILLFRVGDFYETFGEDAVIASKVLGITLTKRNNGAASSSELAGFPYHSLDTYLHKLVKAGHRVAICDQLEDPKTVKGIVKRGVTDMLTPGIATNDKLLEHKQNNFLAALFVEDEQGGIAFLDITTGEFLIAEGNLEYLDKLLQSLQPAEILYPKNYQNAFKEHFGAGFYTYGLDSWIFDEAFATELLLKQFQTQSLKGFGIEAQKLGIITAGAILHYLKETEHPHLQHIHTIGRIDRSEILWMDKFTIRNLELIGNGAGQKGLIDIMDATKSPMGARLLKRWLIFPLQSLEQINQRLSAVAYFLDAKEIAVIICLLLSAILLVYIFLAPFFNIQFTKNLIPHGIAENFNIQIPAKPNRIAIAIGFSAVDKQTITAAIQQGGSEATYLLIHSIETVNANYAGQASDDHESRADRSNLEKYQQDLMAQGYQVEIALGYGNPAKAIAQIVNQSQIDLLVLGAHGHKGIKDIIFGTTLDSLRHRVKVPVLIIR